MVATKRGRADDHSTTDNRAAKHLGERIILITIQLRVSAAVHVVLIKRPSIECGRDSKLVDKDWVPPHDHLARQ
jgi:hypothetical protein